MCRKPIALAPHPDWKSGGLGKFIFLPDEPLLGFIEVPAGPFWMGSTAADDLADDNEEPPQEITLPAYYIARYPVTVGQFRVFVESAEHWQGVESSLRGVANHPVVYACWYDAMTYGEWLTRALRVEAKRRTGEHGGAGDETAAVFWAGLAEGRLVVRLPTEAEWEKAVRGADGRLYPWGDKPDPNLANYDESGIGTTSAIGCFPGGASPYGVEEMEGGVWEWCHTVLQPYPYLIGDGREFLGSRRERVLRGGAFNSGPKDLRCTCRYWSEPDLNWLYVGFRVVVAAPFSPRAGR